MDSNAALAQLQQTQSQTQNPNDILSTQRQQLGVNAAQNTVQGLRGAIDNTTKLLKSVAPSVMGRTAQSLVTSAQAGRQIQNEEAPISSTLNEQTGKYSQASSDADRLEQEAEKSASGIYQGQQDKLSYLQNLYNTLYGREQDATKAAKEEADRQESIRQFNASLASSNARSSGGGSRSATQDAAATKAAVQQHVTQALAANSGSDGFVSRATFGAALNDWQAAGGTPRTFWQNYGRYANPKTKQMYPGYDQR